MMWKLVPIKQERLISRAGRIFKKEGLAGLLSRTLTIPNRVVTFFEYKQFYIFEHEAIERNEADYVARIPNLDFHVVTSNQQAEELAKTGLDVYSQSEYTPESGHTRRRLDTGAIAFCGFVDHKLCHIGWLALDENAKNTFDPWPYPVDFPRQACCGGTRTLPKFEGKGLMSYGYYKRLEYLRQIGVPKSRNVVEASNIASLKVHEKFSRRKFRGHCLKIGWWRVWHETPL